MKSNMDQHDNVDLSVLRAPIPTSVTGFLGVMKAFGDGTTEMRRVLERECDIIYECKVCRNIFRDVANLMTHKRLYCKTAFNSTRDFHFPDNGFISPNISSVIEQECQSAAQWKRDKSSTGELPVRDLGGLVEKMRMKQVLSGSLKPTDYYDLVSSKVTLEDVMQQKHLLYLEKIPQTKVAVYQTVDTMMNHSETDPKQDPKQCPPALDPPMKREVEEVHKLATTDCILGPNGKALKAAEFRDTVAKDEFELETVEELLMLCNYEEESVDYPHECAICDARFETEKTLVLHIQLKHISSTKVYQCPSCSQTFLQAALVIKHLSNDHKKSNKKIRSMREAIHKRHMRLDEVQVKGPTSRELSRLQTEKERADAENKAYLENMANFDNTNQSMCTYCNKIFERKAVLTSHMVNCRKQFEKALLGGGGSGASNGGSSSNGSGVAIAGSGGPPPPSQLGGSGSVANSASVAGGATVVAAKRGPKSKDSTNNNSSSSSREAAKEKDQQLIVDENSSSTIISSDGSNEGGIAGGDENSGAAVNRKRKSGAAKGAARRKRTKKEEMPQQHSKVSELMEKDIWTDDRDDSYFSDERAVSMAATDEDGGRARDESSSKRRFPCEICKKNFSTQSNLKRHNVMFHYFKNRYRCRICFSSAMGKQEAIQHLREAHSVDKEEHEMKGLLKQEKTEVSSSEVLDLDFDESSSNQGKTTTDQGNSSTMSTSSNDTSMPTPNALDNSSTSSLNALTPTPAAATEVRKKRGRPKGSFKKTPPVVVPVDRELRADSLAKRAAATETMGVETSGDQSDNNNCRGIRSKSVSNVPAPPQLMDSNSSSSSTTTTTTATATGTATSSRPIRNRTKPKDKDFVYDLSLLKGHYLYEDEAMDTALSESILTAANATATSSPIATPSPTNGPNAATETSTVNNFVGAVSESVVNKLIKKRGNSTEIRSAEGTEEESAMNGQTRIDGQRTNRSPDQESVEEGEEVVLEVTVSKDSRLINWEKNIYIPTRIIEHRHSVDRAKFSGGSASAAESEQELKKADLRRNSVEIMVTKGAGGGSVKENNRPLGMIENLMETRTAGLAKEQHQEESQPQQQQHSNGDRPAFKQFTLGTPESAAALRRHFGTDTYGIGGSGGGVSALLVDNRVLLNGRSMGEIRSLSSNAGAED